jgi:predicted ATP-grasp superfamily ATP-dependent carboligase
MPKPTALIGFAEAIAAPEVAWSLLDDNFNVIAFTRRGRTSALRHSRHIQYHEICGPESDVQASLSDLKALLRSLCSQTESAPCILFPLDDTALWLCSKVQAEPNWRLAAPQESCIEFALNKQLQTEIAQKAGFNVPNTQTIRTADELFRFVRTEEFPIILKSLECVPVSDGRVCRSKTWICADNRELERAAREWGERQPLLAQQFISGNGEGVFGFATSSGVQAWSAHRRLRMMNPQGSGSSACVSQPIDQTLISKVENLTRAVGWSGLFMIELLQDAAGSSWFVELNGRPWGSMALSRRQGFEYPAWQARLALGCESGISTQSGAAVPGFVCKHAGRELMHLLFVLRGPKSRALTNWPSFWKTLKEIGHVHASMGLYNWRRDDSKVFFADIYYTLRDNLFKTRG